MTPTDAVKISREQFLKLINSRERRAMKRNSLEYKALVIKAERCKKSGKTVRTNIREAVILPEWVGMKFEIHNGKEWKAVTLTANMLGHRIGEYAFSTKRVIHSDPGIRATRGSKFLAMK